MSVLDIRFIIPPISPSCPSNVIYEYYYYSAFIIKHRVGDMTSIHRGNVLQVKEEKGTYVSETMTNV